MRSRRFDFDVLVIGAGSAGFAAALAARAKGAHIGMVEKHVLGGECPNFACVPTKALLSATGRLTWKQALAQKDAIVRSLDGGRLAGILAKEGIVHVKGAAEILDAHTIRVGAREWTAQSMVIAAGTSSFIPEIPGLVEAGFLTYAQVVTQAKLPKSLLMIGGGPVAVELAEIMLGFGVKVVIVQQGKRLLEREEPEISSVVEESLRARGVEVYAGAEVSRVEKQGASRVTVIRQGRMEFEVRTDAILVATGKRSLAREMGVERAGVKLDEHGFVIVNKYLQTSAANIFAAGDVKAGPKYTHVAAYDGDIAGHNAVSERRVIADHAVVPRGTFGVPEVGSVGITEAEALDAGMRNIGVGRAYFAGFGKALTTGKHEGLVKVVADTKSGSILGAGIVGTNAAELIHEIALAMKVGATYGDIAGMMHAYPTGSEVVRAACADIHPL